MNDQLMALFTEHVFSAFIANIVFLFLLQSLGTIITEKPIMIKIRTIILLLLLLHLLPLLLFLKFLQNLLFLLSLLLFILFADLLLLVFLSFGQFLTFLFTSVWLYSHRLWDLSGEDCYFVGSGLLVSEVVVGFVFIHFYASLLILFVYHLLLLVV